MGEGLKVDEARNAAFLLTGVGTWVGKLAYLTADPIMLQEGKRAKAQAISDHRVKARGPGSPRVNPPAQQPFRFNTLRAFHLETSLHTRPPKIDRPLDGLSMAEGTIGVGEIRDYDHLGFHPLLQTEVSKAIGVQSPRHLPYHPGQTVQMVQGVQDEAGDIGRKLA